MFLSKKLENFNKCNVSLIYFFKKKQLQMCCWLLLQVLQEASSWHTTKSKLSGNSCLSLHGRVHPPGAIISSQGTVSTAKTQMKANCSWKNQQCCSISKGASSDSALPLTVVMQSRWASLTSIQSQLHLDLEPSLSPPRQKPLSVSLSENQDSTWTEQCWGNSF